MSDVGYEPPLGVGSGVGASQVKIKSADQALAASNTTPQVVTEQDLVIGASATEQWRVTYWLLMSATSATPDVKFAFNFPSGCTMSWGFLTTASTTAASWLPAGTGVNPNALYTEVNESDGVGIRSGPTKQGVAIVARVFGGGTAGSVVLKSAQFLSDLGVVTVLQNSLMEALKVKS